MKSQIAHQWPLLASLVAQQEPAQTGARRSLQAGLAAEPQSLTQVQKPYLRPWL